MHSTIRKIHLSIEMMGLEEINYENENTDVIIEMTNGDNYAASFFTYKNIAQQRTQHQKCDLFLNGKYYWAERMILIEDLTRKTIHRVVDDLFEEGNFHLAFKKL